MAEAGRVAGRRGLRRRGAATAASGTGRRHALRRAPRTAQWCDRLARRRSRGAPESTGSLGRRAPGDDRRHRGRHHARCRYRHGPPPRTRVRARWRAACRPGRRRLVACGHAARLHHGPALRHRRAASAGRAAPAGPPRRARTGETTMRSALPRPLPAALPA